MRAKDALGRYGEHVAVQHMRAAGLIVLDRNWRCPEGEIDIIARDGAELVVCEVKTRSGVSYGDPLEAITPTKASRLRVLAERWAQAHRLTDRPIRLDVVAVLWQPTGGALVSHVKGAI
jgi:putative endonuclease